MDNYVLFIEYDYSNTFGETQILGTFDSVQNANYFASCRFIYTELPAFKDSNKSLKQVRYFNDKDNNRCRLTLTPTTQNPYDNLGALKLAFKDEPLIGDAQGSDLTHESFLEHIKKGFAIYPYYLKDKVSLQFWGWAINLYEDGTWFFEDTSGG